MGQLIESERRTNDDDRLSKESCEDEPNYVVAFEFGKRNLELLFIQGGTRTRGVDCGRSLEMVLIDLSVSHAVGWDKQNRMVRRN